MTARFPSRRTALALCASAPFAVAVQSRFAQAAEFEYKYHHDQQIDSPMHVRLVQMWNEVSRETNGRLAVQIFGNSSLGTDPAALNQMKNLVTSDESNGAFGSGKFNGPQIPKGR